MVIPEDPSAEPAVAIVGDGDPDGPAHVGDVVVAAVAAAVAGGDGVDLHAQVCSGKKTP